ncbi:MAG: hypothetical protein A2020_03660 [Lentisphaerae bacterium GWF2_45_14]|nr:MAG: hypothetical protein A2020_03660 [Lentisphaerae bacterium GWF2_45_14]
MAGRVVWGFLFFAGFIFCTTLIGGDEVFLANPEMKGEAVENTGLPAGWDKKMVFGLETVCDFKLSDGPDGKRAISLEWRYGGPRFGIEAESKNLFVSGASYEFSALFKTSGASAAVLNAEALDKDGKTIAEWKSKPLTSSAWKKTALFFRAPQGISGIKFYCFNEGQGAVSFSDVSLKKTDVKLETAFPIQAVCMPVEIAKVIYGGNGEFNTFVNAPVPLSFLFKGRAAGKVNSLVVEVPEEIRIAECFNAHTSLLLAEVPDIEKTIRDGKGYRRYTFKNPRTFRILQPSWAWGRVLRMALLPENPDSVGKAFKVYWYIVSGETKSAENSFALNILPPMPKTSNPEKFQLMLWSTHDIDFNSMDILAKVAGIYEESGMNFRARNSKGLLARDDFLEKRAWKMAMTMTDYMHYIFAAGGKGWDTLKDKVELTIGEDGKVDKARICPQYFINDPDFKAYFKEKFLDRLKSVALKDGETVYLDGEPWQPMEWCYCERCRKDFAAYCKLDKVPSFSEIKSRYREQWRDFRCLNTAEVIKMHSDLVNENFPNSKVMDYDYVVKFNKPDFRNYFYNVAKDPQLNEKYFDAHVASYYHYIDKDAFDMIDVNVKNLKKDYWTLGAIDCAGVYLNAKEVINPAQSRMLILASAASGAKGSGFFPGMYIDGKFFLAIDRAMAEIAVLEKFFMQGRRIDSEVRVDFLPYFSKKIQSAGREIEISRPTWKDITGYRAHSLGDMTLISVFNYSPDKAVFTKISAKLPEGKYTMLEPVSGKRILPASGKGSWEVSEIEAGALLDVAPYDVRFLLIRPFAESDTAIPVFADMAGMEKSFEAAKKAFTGAPKLPDTISRDSLSIDYDDADNDKQIEVTLSSTTQKLWINVGSGGTLSGWQADGVTLCDPRNGAAVNQKSMCWDYFWLPEYLRVNGSELESMSIENSGISDGTASVTLKNVLKKAPLEIVKTYRINSSTTGFKLLYDIKNTGDKPFSFSFWSHNFPGLCGDKAGADVSILIPLREGIKILGHEKGSFVFASSENYHPGFKAASIDGMLAGSRVTAQAVKEKCSISAEFEKSQVMAVYIWRQSPFTLEWMYNEVTLEPGAVWHTEINYTCSTK